MKLFWKIFFTTMIVSIACFSIGSYILINSGFQNSLQREVNLAYSENDVLRYSLNEELKNFSETNLYLYDRFKEKKESLKKEELIRGGASSVKVYASYGEFFFRITNKDLKTIYYNFNKNIENKIISSLSKNVKGYEIVKADNKYYVHAIVPFEIDKDIFYLENFRDASEVFQNRNRQYTTYMYIIIIMIIISMVVLFITSWLLTKPIYKLSKATKQIAKGNFKERVYANGYEELEELSKNFNLMASNLNKMIETLREANMRQETFIGSFAHEIKTPLTSMIGYADMLRSKKMNQENVVLSANYIFEEGKRVEALSMKLLEMIILKKQDINMKLISAKEFFKQVKGIMYPVLKKANIDFTISAEDCILKIEPDLMKTVCINLLDNSRKAICNECGSIILSGKCINDGYLITVIDNGKGMEQSELSRITQAFYMVDKSRARVQGSTGLGLAICSEIVNLHGAIMTFKSKLNEGTCVTIKLKGVDDA